MNITYSLSNGKKVKIEGRLGHTQWLCEGRYIMSHSPMLEHFKGVIKSATRIRLGEEDPQIKGHSYTLIVERKGRKPLTARLEPTSVYHPPIIKKPKSGHDIDLSEVIKSPSRPSVKGEPVRQGSVIKVPPGHYTKKRYDRGMVCYDPIRLHDETPILVTGETKGRPINQDGSLGEEFSISPCLKGNISGYGLAIESGGFKVITLGSDHIMHSVGTCL